MAVSLDYTSQNNNGLSKGVVGDTSDSHAVEDESDSESLSTNITQASAAVIPAIKSHVFGSIAVSNSDNVHLGDKYIKIFNGPVNIKQVIQSSNGVDNESYIKTDDENVLHKVSNTDTVVSKDEPKVKINLLLKVLLPLLGILIVGGICAMIILLQRGSTTDSSQDSLSAYSPVKNNSDYTKVVGISYENLHKLVISIILIAMTFCFILYFQLTSVNTNKIRSKNQNVVAVKYSTKTIHDNMTFDEIPLLISNEHLRMVSRAEWLAQPVEGPLDVIKQPVPWVIIAHTATETCSTQSDCVYQTRLIQDYHVGSRKWFDIGYNFLVGGEGSAYYGRGWDYIGAHTKGYNKYSIGIAFIGTFNNIIPTNQQVEACKKLIKQGVDEGKLAKDYKLFVHRQLMSTKSPGDQVYNIVKTWPHFVRNYTPDLIPNY